MRYTAWFDARFYGALGPARLATLRVLTGAFGIGYLLARAPVLASFRGFSPAQFRPVGLATWLSAPLPNALTLAAYLAAVGFGVAFTLGWRFRWTGPAFALLVLWVTSYRNSWGMIFHTDNLLVVHLAILALSDAAAALSLDARGRAEPAPHGRFGWPVRLLCAVTVLAYVLAGIAKLKLSGIGWAHGEILRNYIAYDAVRKAAVGSIYSPLGAWLVQRAWPFPPLGALTLALELLGPLALLHPRAGRFWVAGIYAFHVGVLLSMAIAFPYPLSGVAFASFFSAERLWQRAPLAGLSRFLGAGAPDAVSGKERA